MAKQKTKKCPFDTTATEVKPGRWEWQVDGTRWFREDRQGINTGLVLGNDSQQQLIFTEKLDHAVMYSWGYDAGVTRSRADATQD